MENPDKLATQDTGRRQTTQWTIQIDWQCTQDTGRRETKQWTIQDKLPTQDTGRRQTTQWTIQMNWKHKTHDEDKQNNGQSR